MAEGGDGVVVLVLAYEAETTIRGVLDRMPDEVLGRAPTVLVSDDASTDGTVGEVQAWIAGHTSLTGPAVEVVAQPTNLGYGGNQKAGYRIAIERGAAAVALLHGDGQYPPERLDDLVRPILEGEADAVFGSRMSTRGGARAGRMPLSRQVGNRALSTVQNLLTGARLSEWHTGLRAYRVAALADVDLDELADGFDFDTHLTLTLLGQGARIEEFAIPTHYGDEVSHIQPVRTGLRILGHTVRYRLRGGRRARR